MDKTMSFPMDPMEPPSPARRSWATTTATTTTSAKCTRRRVNSSPWVGRFGPTLNRRGAPWVGNDPKSPKLGALIRHLGLGIDPKLARVALGRKWP